LSTNESISIFQLGIDLLTIPEVTAPTNLKTTNGTVQPSANLGPSTPVVRKMEREYMGMFEYRQQDEAIIMRHLVIGKSQAAYHFKRKK
jgi:hypothetical protein